MMEINYSYKLKVADKSLIPKSVLSGFLQDLLMSIYVEG